MVNNSIKVIRGLGFILAVCYLAFSAWGVHSVVSQTADYMPSSWSVSPGHIAFQIFWPLIAMGILLLLPWRGIRSEWVWWPVFALLTFAAGVHIRGLYSSLRPGLGYFMWRSEYVWPKMLYTVAVILQLIVIVFICLSTIRDERLTPA